MVIAPGSNPLSWGSVEFNTKKNSLMIPPTTTPGSLLPNSKKTPIEQIKKMVKPFPLIESEKSMNVRSQMFLPVVRNDSGEDTSTSGFNTLFSKSWIPEIS